MLDNHCSRSQVTPTAVCFTEIHSNFESVQSLPPSFRPVPTKPAFSSLAKTKANMFECLLLHAGERRPRWASVDYASLSFALLEKDGRGDGIQFPPTLNPRRRQTDDDITALTQNNGPPYPTSFAPTTQCTPQGEREGPLIKDVCKGISDPRPTLVRSWG